MAKESPAPVSGHVGDTKDEGADQSIPKDLPYDYHGVRAHAPATSHGTYLQGITDSLERLEDYQSGGYHPVHLGDCLGAASRYRVLHKLGHGGFGTVWLCRDTPGACYVAVKVMASDVTSESLQDLTLGQLDQSLPGAEHIAMPIDHFSVDGPNGTHQCIVLPVLGPCVSPRLWMRMEKEPGPVLRDMVRQATQALNFLHKNQLCHGDFRPANILVKLTSLDHLSEEEVISLFGQPQIAQVRTESGGELPAFSPSYLVLPADTSSLGSEYLTDQICVIDFGEAYPFTSPPEDLGMPENYLAPEILLEEEDAVGPACDMWALGCTLFEIRQQIPLFYMIYDLDELLAEMVRFFGEFPADWWDKWDARKQFFDEHGNYIRYGDNEVLTLEMLLAKSREITDLGGEPDKIKRMSSHTPDMEQKLMADVLYKLFRYEPGKRATTEEVLEHEWFKL